MIEIKLLRVSEAAEYAQVSRQTIHNWIKAGKLPLYYSAFKSKWKQNKTGWISPLDIDKLK